MRLSLPLPSWNGWISRNSKDGNHQQWMELPALQRFSGPFDELLHEPWRVEWCSGLEDDPHLFAAFIESRYVIGLSLVFAPVMLILFAVAEKVPMELLDVIVGKGNLLPRLEDQLQGFGISRHLLLVSCGERLDFEADP